MQKVKVTLNKRSLLFIHIYTYKYVLLFVMLCYCYILMIQDHRKINSGRERELQIKTNTFGAETMNNVNNGYKIRKED